MKRKFCRDIIALVFLVLLSLQIPAQHKALKVGDVLPEDFWTRSHQIVNSPEKSINLSEHRDKLILLDFWNTWCSACLIAFPHMERLQEKFGNQIFIQAVTGQDRQLLDKFFASKNGQRFKGIKSVTEDKYFNQVFPHIGEPFIVWIMDNKVINTTDSRQVTADNIAEVLKGKSESLQTIIPMDRSRPFMLDESFDRQRNVSMLNYSIFLKGRVPDIGGGWAYRYSENKEIIGRQYTNLPLSSIISSLVHPIFESLKANGRFSSKRIVLNIKDSTEYFGQKNLDGTYNGDDLYSYEYIAPKSKVDSIVFEMLEGLTQHSPFNAKIEILPTDCLVLKRTTKKNKITTKGGELISSSTHLRNAPLWHMVNLINGEPSIRLPIIDETNITGNVDLRVSKISSVEQLNRELLPYGLTLNQERRPLHMLNISVK
ncbi:TlpA family protein disulfide reductase [Chryseobacterium sp. A321]